MSAPSPSPRHVAIDLAATTMGELVSFWGFKASMGKIWTWLYLTSEPLPADRISTLTGLSTGAVSMTLAELQEWGIVLRADRPDERKRRFRAETDVFSIVQRVFERRELAMVDQAEHRFREAIELLEEARCSAPEDDDLSKTLDRLRALQQLATMGRGLLRTLIDVGRLSLLPIQGTLTRSKDP